MRHLMLFLIVGGSATLLQFLLLIAFVSLLALPPILSSALSYGISGIANYWANYHFTFHSNKAHSETLPKFLLTVAIGLVINTLVFSICLFLFDHYLIAQLGATAVTLVSNFLLQKFWIYRIKFNE